MFDWSGCPTGLFDLYMEVGAVQPAGVSTDACEYLEIWIGDSFAKDPVRPECDNIRRRPIYGILKQILKLCGEKKAGLIFMCDDLPSRYGSDSTSWSSAIYLLLRELQKTDKLGPSILFSRNTLSQILQQGSKPTLAEKDRTEYQALYELLDVLVTQQANRYSDPAHRTVIAYQEACLPELDWLLNVNSAVQE